MRCDENGGQPRDPIDRIRERLDEIESDERLGYEKAPVQINAPLAMIQTELKAKQNVLRWVLEVLTDD